MNESGKKKAAMSAEDELIDILLDFIVVSASLAKKITQAVKAREGVKNHGQDERTVGCYGSRPQHGRGY